MRDLTDKELDDLMEIGDKFWVEFSALCEKHIKEATDKGIPHSYATMYLGEKTSIYGRKR